MTEQTLDDALALVNQTVFADGRTRLAWVAVDSLREQEVNANSMPPAMFEQLTDNIKRSGSLESVPLCATREGSTQVEIVSGHHRVKAARRAGLTKILALVVDGITNEELISKQLGHNSIAGQSDPQIVARLFQQLDNIELQRAAFIDLKALGIEPQPVTFAAADINLLANARTVTLVFLPTEADDFSRAIELVHHDADTLYLAHRETFDAFRAAVEKVRSDLEIVSRPTAVAAMAGLVLEVLATKELAEDAAEPDSTEETEGSGTPGTGRKPAKGRAKRTPDS